MHPTCLKIGTCDLSSSILILVCVPLSYMKLLNFWKLIVCLIAWVCCCIEGWSLTMKTVLLPSQNNIDICSYVFICANLLLYMSVSRPRPLLYDPPTPHCSFLFFFKWLFLVCFLFVLFHFYDFPSHNKMHQLRAAGFVMILSLRVWKKQILIHCFHPNCPFISAIGYPIMLCGCSTKSLINSSVKSVHGDKLFHWWL